MNNTSLPINRKAPAPAGAAAAHWLALALGKDESRKAMQLPTEIRESLYGDVLWYGPAASQIADFIAALANTKGSNMVWNQLEWLVWDSQLTYTVHLPYMQHSEVLSLEVLLRQWVDYNSLQGLYNQFTNTVRNGVTTGNQTASATIIVLCFMTGQYLFPSAKDGFLSQVSPFTKQVNTILATLGLGELGGLLSRGTTN